MHIAAHIRYASQCGRGRRSQVTQMLRQTDADVFKLYSQAKLGMMREALAKLNRQANERRIFSTQSVN